MKIRFIGALGTVTGSCTLFTLRRRYYLVDCGATQGNDAIDGTDGTLPFKASGINGVFLTHAHLDHCGMLPQLAKQGFRGNIYCTQATADLTKLALTDAALLPTAQFSANDVDRLRFVCLDNRPDFQFCKSVGLEPNFSVALIRTSHILGSVGFEFQYAGSRDGKSGRGKPSSFPAISDATLMAIAINRFSIPGNIHQHTQNTWSVNPLTEVGIGIHASPISRNACNR